MRSDATLGFWQESGMPDSLLLVIQLACDSAENGGHGISRTKPKTSNRTNGKAAPDLAAGRCGEAARRSIFMS